MGTTQLLVKCRATGTLPDLNEYGGTRWRSHGKIFMVRYVFTPMGTKTSVSPCTGIDALDHRKQQVYSLNFSMTQTPELGRFSFDAQTNQSVPQWPSSAKTEPVTSGHAVYDRINKANGATYNKRWLGGKTEEDNATCHPLGGCSLGLATGNLGEVKSCPGMYVMDSSMFPDSLVANPTLSTMAFAERSIERIIAQSR